MKAGCGDGYERFFFVGDRIGELGVTGRMFEGMNNGSVHIILLNVVKLI
jgi:hypothetical protein